MPDVGEQLVSKAGALVVVRRVEEPSGTVVATNGEVHRVRDLAPRQVEPMPSGDVDAIEEWLEASEVEDDAPPPLDVTPHTRSCACDCQGNCSVFWLTMASGAVKGRQHFAGAPACVCADTGCHCVGAARG